MQDLIALNSAIAESYRDSKEKGFPAFPIGVERSNPINSTPFLELIERIGELAGDPCREGLLKQLGSLLDVLRSNGVEPIALLVGGSFLRPLVPPKDLDCVLFYQSNCDIAARLMMYQRNIAQVGVDVRFVPIDSDPLIVLKSAIYFGTLYGMRKDGDSERQGVVLFDCRTQGGGQ
ncbi:DUF6932 family protein [Xanthomonas translucens]|uniref:DUF6932 family protein n=1 Tax=Xanthomonas campestris pv. translucens TaxID=343 RepID=UPI0012D9BF4F|nr:hypothetical protein [Xanthomonas translucens]